MNLEENVRGRTLEKGFVINKKKKSKNYVSKGMSSVKIHALFFGIRKR
jgi:hypothetical protein